MQRMSVTNKSTPYRTDDEKLNLLHHKQKPPYIFGNYWSALWKCFTRMSRSSSSLHTSWFIGSLRTYEIIPLIIIGLGVILRIVYHISQNHFGRAGKCAEYSLVVCVLLSLRSNVVTTYFKISWEHMIVLHKVFAVVSIGAAIAHSLPLLVENSFPTIYQDTQLFTGVVLLTLLLAQPLVYLLKYIHFEWFYVLHVMNYMIMMYIAIQHEAELIFLFGIAWLIDVAIRYLLTAKETEMRLTLSPCKQFVSIEYPTLSSYTHGQYAFIMIPQYSYLELHPFSYISAHTEPTTRHVIKVTGGFTRHLASHAERHSTIRGFIEGPYGQVGIDITKYRMVVIISGGIGCTPNISALKHLSELHAANDIHLKRVEFLWSLREKDCGLVDMTDAPAIIQSFSKSDAERRCAVDATVYVTQQRHVTVEAPGRDNDVTANFWGGVSRVDSRLNIRKALLRTIDLAATYDEDKVAVLVCGPSGMVTDAVDVCNQSLAGSVQLHLHHETFNL